MHLRPPFFIQSFLVMFFLLGVAPRGPAQPLSLSLEASRTSLTIETTTPVEVLAQFEAKVLGARLGAGALTAPTELVSTLGANESGTQLSFASLYLPSQVELSPSAALDAAWPAGSYGFHVEWSLANGTPKSGGYPVEASAEWPATPVVRSPRPLFPLTTETVEFEWAPWADAPSSGGDIGLTLYEGLVTVELLQQIAAGDLSGLGTFSVVAAAVALPPETTTHVCEGVDPGMDHVLVLDFSRRSTGTTVPTPTESRVSRMVTFFYRATQTTYAEWRAEQFSESDAADDAVSGPLADPDADGLANLLEYAAAAPPLVSDSAGATTISLLDGVLAVDRIENSAAVDLSWTYERMEEDLSWRTMAPEEFTLTTISVRPGSRTVRMTPLATGSRELFRVRVTLDP